MTRSFIIAFALGEPGIFVRHRRILGKTPLRAPLLMALNAVCKNGESLGQAYFTPLFERKHIHVEANAVLCRTQRYVMHF